MPIQAWAKALLKERNDRFLANEPYTRCKPSPGSRSVVTAYGIELLNVPGSGRVYLFQTGGAGVVRDSTGAVLPGVTVEAASPALIEKVRSVIPSRTVAPG